MELFIRSDESGVRAELSGKFTFSNTVQFKELLDRVEKEAPPAVEVDLTKISFVDSAALGMLLLLKDAATKHAAPVTLKGANGQVEKLLRMSRFDQIFSIAA